MIVYKQPPKSHLKSLWTGKDPYESVGGFGVYEVYVICFFWAYAKLFIICIQKES